MANFDKSKIQCFPFSPGRVSGRLSYSVEAAKCDEIVVVNYPNLDRLNQGWLGIIVIDGAPFSHAMVRIIGFGIPTIIITSSDASLLKDGMQVTLDGDNGIILLNVESGILPTYSNVVKPPDSGSPVMTHDSVAVSLRASVRDAQGAKAAIRYGAESIGLVRSEFLVPENNAQPGFTFYCHAFQEIIEEAKPLTVTVRLLDLASDKKPAWMPDDDRLNKPLGLQGSRLFHNAVVKKVFHAQLKALDQLSDHYDLRLLIPYLIKPEEVSYWVDEIRANMTNPVSIGAMVETPAGALDAGNWFELVDFVAIGCNDLMQCLYAADRDEPALRNYLDPYAPLLYRFLQQVAESTTSHLANVQLCGILSQLQGVLPILLGLGFRAFSVEPRLIPTLAQVIKRTDIKDARLLAGKVCEAKRTGELRQILGLPEDNARLFG